MATVTPENIKILVELQKWDSAIHKLNDRVEAIPGEIARLEARIRDEKENAESLKNESRRLQAERKEKENDLAVQEAAIKKHQEELNKVKSNTAFKALQHEIDGAKAAKDKLEEEVLELMEAIDVAVVKEKEAAKLVASDIVEIEKTIAGLRTEAQTKKAEALLKAGDRDKVAGQVPPAILKQYDAVSARRKGVALAAVKDGVCGGCHMKLTPSIAMAAKAGSHLTVCEGCSRILYVE